MAGTVVTDNWVTDTFGDKLDGKNGLYIIFRVEGIKAIEDGFILKHYGVTGDNNNDKLNLDNHRIVYSKSLINKEPKIKIDSTNLMLGIKKDCTLSGMGFVKKDNVIRPFVDVDYNNTNIDTIRKRLDNESTINNFFNHNIYDWFIKEKIRQHINANGEGDDFEDNASCNGDEFNIKCKLNQLKANKLQLLYHFMLKGNNEIEIQDEYNTLLNALDNKEKDNFNNRVKEIANIKNNGNNFISTYNISNNEELNSIALNAASVVATGQQNWVKQLPSNASVKIHLTNKNAENENTVDFQTNKYNKIKEVYGFPLYGGTNIENMTDGIHYKTDHEDIKGNIKTLTKFFRSNFKLILAIPGNFASDYGYNEIWETIITTIHNNAETKPEPDIKTIKEDLFSLFFVYKQYYDVNLIDSCKVISEYNTLQISNIIKKYNSVYYMNDAFKMCNYLREALFQKSYESDNDHFFHIADLIEIYNWFTEKYASTQKDIDGEQVTTILRLLNNYFTDIKENFWWTTIQTDNNIINKSIEDVIKKFSIKKSMTTINENKLMTFVKINNYSEDLTKWNVTYMPYMSSDNNFLHLEVRNFGDDNSQKNFYFGGALEGQGDGHDENVVSVQNQNQGNVDAVDKSDATSKSDKSSKTIDIKTYTFGGFSQVFLPNQPLSGAERREEIDNKNNDIDEMIAVKETTTIIKKIIKKEKVFIFGYGASGAGKTAMLVYNNVKQVDGYCIRLCKEIAKAIIKDDESKTVLIKLRIEEFYNNGNGGKGLVYKDNGGKFNRIDNGFVEKTLVYHGEKKEAEDFDEEDDDETDKKIYDNFIVEPSNPPNEPTTDLKDLLTTYVTLETDKGKRTIKPTRNNPQSSRSHVMIYIDFKTKKRESDEEELGTLMIADLAGVENPFDPFDCDTIVDTFTNLYKNKKMPDDDKFDSYFENYATDEAKEGKIKLNGAFDNLKTYMHDTFTEGETEYNLPLDDKNTYTYKSDLNQEIDWEYDVGYFRFDDIKEEYNYSGTSTAYDSIVEKFVDDIKKQYGYEYYDFYNNLDKYQEEQKEQKERRQIYQQMKKDKDMLDVKINNNKYTYPKGNTREEYLNVLRSIDNIIGNIDINIKTEVKKKFIVQNADSYTINQQFIGDLLDEICYIYFESNNFDDNITFYNSHFVEPRLYDNGGAVQKDIHLRYLSLYDGKTKYEPLVSILEKIYSILNQNKDYQKKYRSSGINNFPDTEYILDVNLRDTLKTKLESFAYADINNDNMLEFYGKNESSFNIIKPARGYKIENQIIKFNNVWSVLYFLSRENDEDEDDGFDVDIKYITSDTKKLVINRFLKDKKYKNIELKDLNTSQIIIENITWDQSNQKFKCTFKLVYDDTLFNNIKESFIDDFRDKNKSFTLTYKNDKTRNIGLLYSNYYSNFDKIDSIIGNILDGIKVKLQNSELLNEGNFIKPLNEQLIIEPRYDKEKENSVNTKADKSLRYVVSEIRARQKEGDYINKQLEYLRTTLFASMYHKSDGLLFSGPTIQPNCENSMCNLDSNNNSLENCFLMKCKKVAVGTDSNLSDFLKDIVTKYFKNITVPDGMNKLQYKVDQALKNINILIFTVFNISEKKTEINHIKFEHINENEFLYPYVEPTKFIDLEPIHTSNVTDRNKYATNINNLFKKDDEHPSIKNTSIKEEINKCVSGMNRNFSIDDKNSLLYKLDLFNASTPLGTLIFTDNMAKFGINKICHIALKEDDKKIFAIRTYTDDNVGQYKQYLTNIEENKNDTKNDT